MSARELRVLLVDDEPLALQALRELVKRLDDVRIVAERGDGESALEAIRETRPDVVLLDIQMPRMDGFELLRRLGAAPPPLVIFVTAYDHYAVRAFRALALDYLLKPCSEKDLRQALDRARDQLDSEHLSEIGRRMLRLVSDDSVFGQPEKPEYLRQITARKRKRTVLVDVGEIEWIEADDYCVRIHQRDGEVHVLRRSLKWFGERLDPEQFLRVHRSALINRSYLREILHLAADDHMAVLASGAQVPISRSGREALDRFLDPS